MKHIVYQSIVSFLEIIGYLMNYIPLFFKQKGKKVYGPISQLTSTFNSNLI